MQLFCGQRVIESIDMEHEENMKRQVLEVCRDYLCQRLILTTHISFLRSRFILNIDDDHQINAEKTNREKNEKFLDIISTKGSRGYDEFCNAIRAEGTTGHLLERLDTELRKLVVNSEGDRDEAAEGLPRPGDPGAPPLPFPYTNNSNSRPYSYNSSQA